MIDGSSYGKKGLIPLKRVINLGLSRYFNLPEKSEEGAVFGLLEPAPKAWMIHQYHKGEGLLETVLGDAASAGGGMVLLKCHVQETDDIYVADHVFHMRPDYNGAKDTKNKVTGEVKRAYWNSMVPFSQYLGGHTVPEVICFSSIPLERLEIVKVYPDVRDLINELRIMAGYKTLPPRKEPDYRILEDILVMKPS